MTVLFYLTYLLKNVINNSQWTSIYIIMKQNFWRQIETKLSLLNSSWQHNSKRYFEICISPWKWLAYKYFHILYRNLILIKSVKKWYVVGNFIWSHSILLHRLSYILFKGPLKITFLEMLPCWDSVLSWRLT